MGLGFSIIALAGAACIPWDLERVTVVTNILLVVLNFTVIVFGNGVGVQILQISAMMVPAVIFFSFLGHYLTRRLSSSLFEKAVYSFIGLAGVLNIVQFFV